MDGEDLEIPLTQPIDPNDDIVYPEETKWEDRGCCFCCRRALILPTTRIFCGKWEAQIFMPMMVFCLSIGCYLIFIFTALPDIENRVSYYASIISITFSMLMFMWSYFAAVCMDPGYLPYDWIKTQQFWYSASDLLTGTAIRDDQFTFAHEHRAPGSSFSRASGKFVIRADHICGWITNWVGKRNHKQFLLMNIWGSVYSTVIFGFHFAISGSLLGTGISMFLRLFSMCFEITFALSLISMSFQVMIDLAKNRTKIQRWKKEHGESIGCCPSFREICGNGSPLMWLIPTPAFDETLVIPFDMPAQEPMT